VFIYFEVKFRNLLGRTELNHEKHRARQPVSGPRLETKERSRRIECKVRHNKSCASHCNASEVSSCPLVCKSASHVLNTQLKSRLWADVLEISGIALQSVGVFRFSAFYVFRHEVTLEIHFFFFVTDWLQLKACLHTRIDSFRFCNGDLSHNIW
jgi:hypothetical protein